MELHIKFILLCGYVDFVILRQILFKDSPLMRQRRSLLNLNFNDPDFTDPDWITQWYLNGQTTNMNIISAWKKGYTGRGVVITVIDKGVEMNHPEFGTRFNKNASFNFVENNTDPTAPIPPGTTGQARALLSHGTNVAGLAAAEANNSKCGVGVAYECSIGGIRIHLRTDNNPASNDAEAKALKYRSNITDIYACAWGPPDHGGGIGRLKPKSKVSIYNTITYGREGKGGIFVFPAGNGGRMSDSCSYDEYVNSIYTIAVTAVSNKGKRLSLNEACTAIITTVYSRDGTKSPSEPDDGMATADVNGACTKSIDGTSAATGVSAGMIALMLQANPALTWRDAQHLIIHSSYPTLDDLWQTNGYGLKVSNYFGFGLLDALSMVNNAVNWTRVPQQKKCEFMVDLPDRPFNYSHPLKQIIDVSNWPSRCGGKANRIKYLEHVVVTLNLRLASRTDLEVELTSPIGTKSLLIRPRGMLDQYYSKLKDFSVLSLHHWGENPTGRWTIEFRARNSRRSNQGMVFKWSITFFGTLTDPLSKNNITRRPSISTTAGGMVFNTTMTSTLSGNKTVQKTTISSPTQGMVFNTTMASTLSGNNTVQKTTISSPTQEELKGEGWTYEEKVGTGFGVVAGFAVCAGAGVALIRRGQKKRRQRSVTDQEHALEEKKT